MFAGSMAARACIHLLNFQSAHNRWTEHVLVKEMADERVSPWRLGIYRDTVERAFSASRLETALENRQISSFMTGDRRSGDPRAVRSALRAQERVHHRSGWSDRTNNQLGQPP